MLKYINLLIFIDSHVGILHLAQLAVIEITYFYIYYDENNVKKRFIFK